MGFIEPLRYWGKLFAGLWFVLLLLPFVAQAKSLKVSWNTSPIEVSILAGTQQAVQVTFTPSEDATGLSAEVVPEIAPFVTVLPETLDSVYAGSPVNLTLLVSVPADAVVGEYSGTLHIREGTRTIARPLPTSIFIQPKKQPLVIERVTAPVSAMSDTSVTIGLDQSRYSAGFEIFFPLGSLDHDGVLALGDVVGNFPDVPDGLVPIGLPISVELMDANLIGSATITIPYSTEKLLFAGVTSLDYLKVFSYDPISGTWEEATIINIDPEKELITVSTDHLSWWWPFSKDENHDGIPPTYDIGDIVKFADRITGFVFEEAKLLSVLKNPDLIDPGITLGMKVGAFMTALDIAFEISDGDYVGAVKSAAGFTIPTGISLAGYPYLASAVGFGFTIKSILGDFIDGLDVVALNNQFDYYAYYRDKGCSHLEVAELTCSMIYSDCDLGGWLHKPNFCTAYWIVYPNSNGRLNPEQFFELAEKLYAAKELAENKDVEQEALAEEIRARYQAIQESGSPVAAFVISPSDTGNTPFLVYFDASSSVGGSGADITDYQWDFGDWGSGTGITVNHIYLQAGDYQVSLTVTDSDGRTDSTAQTIHSTLANLDNILPIPEFDYEVGGIDYLLVNFDGSASSDPDGDVVYYKWIFQNGDVAFGPTATTSYTNPGDYEVTLEVTDNSLGKASITEFVSVGTPPLPTANLTANPASIVSGEPSTLTWSSTYADSCTGTEFSTGGSTSGNVSVSPLVDTTYILTCTGSGGTASDQVTVSVSAPPSSYEVVLPVASISEDAGTLAYTITRSDSTTAETVYFSTVQNQGFTNNGDYVGKLNEAVNFAVGENQVPGTITINDDTEVEDDEKFGLIVQQSPSDPIDVYLAEATFTILDDDTQTTTYIEIFPQIDADGYVTWSGCPQEITYGTHHYLGSYPSITTMLVNNNVNTYNCEALFSGVSTMENGFGWGLANTPDGEYWIEQALSEKIDNNSTHNANWDGEVIYWRAVRENGVWSAPGSARSDFIYGQLYDSSGFHSNPINGHSLIGSFTTGPEESYIRPGTEFNITARNTSGYASCNGSMHIDIGGSDVFEEHFWSIYIPADVTSSSEWITYNFTVPWHYLTTTLTANTTYYVFTHTQCSGGSFDIQTDASGNTIYGYIKTPAVNNGDNPFFMGLGFLEENHTVSFAEEISDNGQVVVGWSNNPPNQRKAFRWDMNSKAMSGLGVTATGWQTSQAYAVSSDGLVIVGAADGGGSAPRAFRWEFGTGPRLLPGLPDRRDIEEGYATAVSSDGTVVVGIESLWHNAEGTPHQVGVVWVDGGDPSILNGTDTGPYFHSYPRAANSDASIIVGQARFSYTEYGAFKWTEVQGFENIVSTGVARDITSDGSVIVGVDSITIGEAFRWTQDGTLTRLGTLIDGWSSQTFGVSDDGKIVVGTTGPGGNGTYYYATIWTPNDGLRNLQDVLATDYGLGNALEGWRLSIATAISSDGRTIVGWGLNPDGKEEAWIARVDSWGVEEPYCGNSVCERTSGEDGLTCPKDCDPNWGEF